MEKFKDAEQLERAYKELEKEFTKKSQSLAILEKNKSSNFLTVLMSAVEHYQGLFEEMEKEKNHKIKTLNLRWEKLKRYIADTKPLRGTNIYFLQETLLEKIEELEKENYGQTGVNQED